MAKRPNTKKPIYEVNWYDDKYQSVVVFRNWMLLITLISILGIFMMTLASFYFVPLKSVSPFVIQIDENSGVTEVVDSKTNTEFTSNEMLIKHFALKYILSREEYNFRTVQDNMQVVRIMSLPDVYRSYISDMLDTNGPIAVFAAHTERRLSLISSNVKTNKTSGDITIDARFGVVETSTQRQPLKYTIAVTMICHFDSSAKLTDDQRMINPLGFVVIYYASTKERYENKTTPL